MLPSCRRHTQARQVFKARMINVFEDSIFKAKAKASGLEAKVEASDLYDEG